MEGVCPGWPRPAWNRAVNELRSTAWCRPPLSRWPVAPPGVRTAPRPPAVTGAPPHGTARIPATASMGAAGQPGRPRWRRAAGPRGRGHSKQSDLVWQSAITWEALERPKTSSCADDNFFLDKGHDPTSIDSLDKRKIRQLSYRMQRLRWHKKLQCHCAL